MDHDWDEVVRKRRDSTPLNPEELKSQDPDHPLQPQMDELISPAENLPRTYFNVSNFQTWRLIHDSVRPKERLDWRQPMEHAYCILSGVGKRPIYWQPKLVQDFFHQHHQHSHREQGPMFPQHSSHGTRGHDFQYFWNTDTNTNQTKAYSMFITASSFREHPLRGLGKVTIPMYQTKRGKHRLEHCRQTCETCFDAAQETGAEQFICTREEKDRHDSYPGNGLCRAAMVLGDPIGRSRTCQITRRTNRACGDDLEEVYAQDGAVRNPYPSLECDSIRPCKTDACQLNETRLLAQGASCKLLAGDRGGSMTAVAKARWPLLGYTSLAQAMNDSSLFIYYQGFSRDATSEEKAFVLDSASFFAPDLPVKEYGTWWTNYTPGESTPLGWNGTTTDRPTEVEFNGGVGFGSVPGGFVLQNTPYSKHLVETLGKIDLRHREHHGGKPIDWVGSPAGRDGPVLGG